MLAALDGAPLLGPINAETVDAARSARRDLVAQVPLSDLVTRTDVTVPRPGGPDPGRIRLHRRVDLDGPAPALFWVHGGGFVLGMPEQDDARFDQWCRRHDLVGAAVEYRLAPEHPYPAGLEDCYSALKWLKHHGPEVDVDPDRIGIGGPSGGGGIAAALALLVRDRGEFEISHQMLIYPMIDDTQSSVSAGWEHVPVWDPSSNRFGWSSYLTGTGDDPPHHAAPTRATDLTGLPPTFIMVGGFDGFLDENIDYAQRLIHAGVAVELHVYPGAPHGFDLLAPDAPVSVQARSDLDAWLGRMLDR